MKRIILLLTSIALCIMLNSCESTYRFYQIYETKPIPSNNIKFSNDGFYEYENEHCNIIYYLWENKGCADVWFINKSQEIIYIDLTKSFFINNNKSYDLYLDREWSNSTSTGVVESTSRSYWESFTFSASANVDFAPGRIYSKVGNGNIGAISASANKSRGNTSGSSVVTSQTTSETIGEKPIIAIPPHSMKIISTSSIIQKAYYSCDLVSYPSVSSRISFTPENSPIRFGNYFTYTVGDNKTDVTVENYFYVSDITNYAEPEALEFKKRDKTCENLPWFPEFDYQTNGGAPLYDCYIKNNICNFGSSFYYQYEIETFERLYKNTIRYKYNSFYKAYTK